MAGDFSARVCKQILAPSALAIILTGASSLARGADAARALGEFEGCGDVGQVTLPGSCQFLPECKQYRIQGSGKNMWGNEDAFQFLWKRISGDLQFCMDVAWVGEGKMKHRKACAMVRQSLDADVPYVNVAVHGDGLIAMQFRRRRGALRSVCERQSPRPRRLSWSATATCLPCRSPSRAVPFSRWGP